MAKKKKRMRLQKDSFNNLERGLGGGKDTTVSTTFSRDRFMNFQTVNDLYTTDWLAAAVVDIPIDEAYREGRFVIIEDQDQRSDFEEGLKQFQVDQKFATAAKWARAFGGAVIIMLVDDGKTLDQPLIVEDMREGSLKNLIVLDRYDVFPQDINLTNPLADNFLEPINYTISQGATKIHHSRIIKFDGTSTTNQERKRANYFGLSIYDRIFKAIMESQTSSDLISNLIFQSNVDVTQIDGLNELIAAKETELILERMRIASLMKSNLNMLVLDGKDTYQNIAKNFSGLAEIDDKFFEKVSGASGIPVTKLSGTSSAGMNATGEGDLKNYYDMVRSKVQRGELGSKYDTFDPILSMHLFGKDIGVKFEWESLWQMSKKEKAEIESSRATADSVYLTDGVIDETDIKARLAEEGTYPTITLESVAKEIEETSELNREPTE